MSTLTLIGYFEQINDDLMECLYNYVEIHNFN